MSFGTTNIDFSKALFDGVQQMRSYRRTRLTIGREAVGLATEAAGPSGQVLEKRIRIPDSWLRGFLQVQSAAALPLDRFAVAPADLYNLLRHLRVHADKKGKRRGLRVELVPGEFPRIVLEPWEVVLPVTSEPYRGRTPKVVRVWGRRRLMMIQRVLPFVDRVEVHLLGSGLPSFWVFRAGDVTLTLGLTGFTAANWSQAVSFDLLLPGRTETSTKPLDAVIAHLHKVWFASANEIGAATKLKGAALFETLQSGCQQGRLMFDLAAGVYRLRPLIDAPLDLRRLEYRNARERIAHDLLVRRGAVKIVSENRIATVGLELTGRYWTDEPGTGEPQAKSGKGGKSPRDKYDLPDAEERAAENELPPLDTPQQLAEALGLTVAQLRWLCYHREAATRIHYRRFVIAKRDGSPRPIWAPLPTLKAAQRWVLKNIVERLPVHGAAHGFLEGRSTVTNAERHEDARLVLKMDVKGFFPTVTLPRVKGVFRKAGYREQVATLLALLCTEAPREIVEDHGTTYYVALGPRCLPQGAPTSPALTNALCLRLDRRLSGLARQLGWRYSRYADDMTFSLPADHKGPPKLGALMGLARRVVEAEGFAIQPDKTRVHRRGGRQTVTGLVVNGDHGPRVPRALRRQLRAAAHNLRTGRPLKGGESLSRLAGLAAYVAATDHALGAALLKAFRSTEAGEVVPGDGSGGGSGGGAAATD